MQTARYVIQLILAIGLPLLVQRWDRRRLTKEQRERAWNCASWGAALYGFNIFSMIPWYWVTRKNGRGVALGLATTVLLIVVVAVADQLVAEALGIPQAPLW